MDETQLRELILKAISEAVGDTAGTQSAAPVPPASGAMEGGEVRDLSAVDFRQIIDVPTPANPEEFHHIRPKTMAHIGVWRAGPRCRTNTYLWFRADHAAAMDAVFTDVPKRLLEEMGLFTVQTLCETRDMYLTRPDLGRRFSQEILAELQQRCKRNPDVQLVVSDGLSGTPVSANLRDVLPATLRGLSSTGVSVGTPSSIRYGHVGAMDAVTEALGSEVIVILLDEHPGLAIGESMSVYMTYGGYVGIPEASRTVVSNTHRGGTNPAEAGAFIAELRGYMLKERTSDLTLKL